MPFNPVKFTPELLAAFKAFIYSHKLEIYNSEKAREKGQFLATFTFFETADGQRHLLVDTLAENNVFQILQRQFPSQVLWFTEY